MSVGPGLKAPTTPSAHATPPGTAVRLEMAVVSGFGAVCAVGMGVRQTCTSIRAGLSRFSEHDRFECLPDDPELDSGSPLTAAGVASLQPDEDSMDWLLHLGSLALGDLFTRTSFLRRHVPTTALSE